MPDPLSQWQVEPWLLACIVVVAVPYAAGMARMGTQRGAILGRWRPLSFSAGLAILLLALVSPLDGLAEDLFSAHMVQHMLLLLVVPPLLVYGRPVITWLWAFDLDARRAIARGWKRIGLEFAFRWLMKPLCVWLLLAAALCFWHLPGPYDAAVRREWLHDLEHASFLFFSLAFWTIVIEPYGRRRALGYGATMVFIVSSGVVMGLLGAVLTFASAPLYAVHVHATPEYGLTALQDQQLAGIIMWIPSNLVHVAALSTLFFAWFRADESGARRAIPRAAARLLVLCAALASLALVGCARDRQAEAQAAAAHRGARLIAHYGCGACHSIPGINGADGLVGPPLDHWSRRSYIAGVLPNDPANLTLWIRHPQAVVPGVDMPEMGVKTQDARDIAAYLYSIQ